MNFFKKTKEFVSDQEEIGDVVATSIKDAMEKTDIIEKFGKNWRIILLISTMVITSIFLDYRTQNLSRNRIALERRVRDLRFESINTAAKLMFIRKESEVLKKVKAVGLKLEESKEAPIKIYK